MPHPDLPGIWHNPVSPRPLFLSSLCSKLPIHPKTMNRARRSLLPNILALTPALLATLAWAPSADASTITGGAGMDYQTGPQTQSYRSALLFGYAEGSAGDVTLAGIRYGDSRLGPGTGLFANGSIALGPRLRARAVALRAMGDSDYRAWRWRLGPEVRMRGDRVLGAYYQRLTTNAGDAFDALGVELSGPVMSRVTGQIGSSYGRWSSDATTTQGSLSGTWQAMPRILVLGEIDVGRNLATTSAANAGGGGGLGGLPLPGGLGGPGGGTTTQTTSELSEAAQIGVRFLFR